MNADDRRTARLPIVGKRFGPLGLAGYAAIALFWLGMLVGVSFLATPVKFAAPSLGLSTALEVGRVTFALFGKVEWALCVLLIGAAFMIPGRQLGLRLIALAGLPVLLAVQTFWLLPVLDARVERIIAGAIVPATGHHVLYVAIEATKALLLVGVSVAALWSFRLSAASLPCE